ncbi:MULTISPECIES: class I SAM-dependent methyltransferase [Falsihalocynthiibacter]|uniref:class I SAM-dependent methyltransferase n=1 Tax=Falsihalocynthiibacter TaxID=2854182 RepID=UPI003002DFAF
MSNTSSNFVGDIPSYYDSGLGPNIFFDYADLLATRCASLPATNVVELAAGTGILSRRLRDRLSPETRLEVTDLNLPMLQVAKNKFTNKDVVDFTVANAMDLPFEDSEFDMMVCQFGVMFFPDKPASYREAARVLKKNGYYLFNVWSAMSKNPFAQIAYDAAAKFFPNDPPAFYRVPFHYGDPVQVRADLAQAGWHDVEHETIQLQKTITNLEAFATALVFGNPIIDEIRQRGEVEPTVVAEAILEAFHSAFGPSPITIPLETTTFVCRAP